jgi:hypothetical protein
MTPTSRMMSTRRGQSVNHSQKSAQASSLLLATSAATLPSLWVGSGSGVVAVGVVTAGTDRAAGDVPITAPP